MTMETRGKQDVSRPAANRTRSMQRYPEQRYPAGKWDPADWAYSPFAFMRQMQDQVGRFFNSAWPDRDWLQPASARLGEWSPAVDVFLRGNEFVIRADVPGMSRDDVSVEIGDEAVTLRGDRKYEHDEEREGVFRSERSYGSFVRVIPLPEGAITDSAKATFKNGVLEVVIQAPPSEVRRGRRLDIKEEKQDSERQNKPSSSA